MDKDKHKHTPGPWVVGEADWSDAGNARYELRGIKTVSALDARLIAAAPDLLEALIDAVSTQPADSPIKWVLWARAAIAKATGVNT